MISPPKIIGDNIYLRPLELTDLERCLKWVNDSEVTRHTILERRVLNRDREEEWLRDLYKKDTDLPLAICLNDKHIHIGNCSLSEIDYCYRYATFGIIIGEKDFWGKGFGLSATRLMVNFGFRVLNLNRIELHTDTSNQRGSHCYQKAGFKQDGLLRQKYYINGTYHDAILMSILRDEWTIF